MPTAFPIDRAISTPYTHDVGSPSDAKPLRSSLRESAVSHIRPSVIDNGHAELWPRARRVDATVARIRGVGHCSGPHSSASRRLPKREDVEDNARHTCTFRRRNAFCLQLFAHPRHFDSQCTATSPQSQGHTSTSGSACFIKLLARFSMLRLRESQITIRFAAFGQQSHCWITLVQLQSLSHGILIANAGAASL